MNFAHRAVKGGYVIICSNAIEAAYNPGGSADFDGLAPHVLFYALDQLVKKGIQGLDKE